MRALAVPGDHIGLRFLARQKQQLEKHKVRRTKFAAAALVPDDVLSWSELALAVARLQ